MIEKFGQKMFFGNFIFVNQRVINKIQTLDHAS